MSIDFRGLAATLLAQAEELVPAWFPAGKRSGKEWVVGNLRGDPGDSLSINLKTGLWSDFATNEAGGDLIALYAAKEGLEQAEAARRLGGDDTVLTRSNGSNGSHAPVEEPQSDDVLRRAPVDTPFDGRSSRFGDPVAIYAYSDLAGVLFYVCRYERPGERKQFQPWRWNGSQWISKAAPRPRALYGLQRLIKSPQSRVLIVEGEKCADAAQRLMKETVVMTWSGGSGAVAHSDWSVLKGRAVTVWPDADDAGKDAALKLCGVLHQIGASSVVYIDVTGQPDGWDLADAIQEGWTLEKILQWGKAHRREITRDISHSRTIVTPEPENSPVPSKSSLTSTWDDYGLSTEKGRPHANLDNIVRILTRASGWWSGVWFDEFLQRTMLEENGRVVEWSDRHDLMLTVWIQREMQIPIVRAETIHQAISMYAYHRKRNEVQEWLESLKWDGTWRLPLMLATGWGTAMTPYTESVGRCFMVGMVARVLDPGCQLDNMPVFEGPQGAFKSSALRVLGGKWFCEQHERVGQKDFYMVLKGKMLVEITELSSFNRQAIEQVKGVITNREDTFRAPYDRRALAHPRQCVFAGTTNADDWNMDDTGARRFWPILVGKINLKWITEQRYQLFAEAVHRFKLGEPWYDVPAEMAQQEQQARQSGDVFDEALEYFLRTHPEVMMQECLRDGLGMDKPEKWDRVIQMRVASVLRRSGYVRVSVRRDGQVIRIWRKRL